MNTIKVQFVIPIRKTGQAGSTCGHSYVFSTPKDPRRLSNYPISRHSLTKPILRGEKFELGRKQLGMKDIRAISSCLVQDHGWKAAY